MATKICGPKSKFGLFPDRYDCVNGRSVMKKEFKLPRGPRTDCSKNVKFTSDPRYECSDKTNFRWKLKKGFKAVRPVGVPKKPASAFFLWMNDNRKAVEAEVGLKGAMLVRVLGERWKSLDERTKELYKQRALEAKKSFEEFKLTHANLPLKQIVEKAKRQPSEWILFNKRMRPVVRAEHPDWKFGQVSKEVGRLWQEAKNM